MELGMGIDSAEPVGLVAVVLGKAVGIEGRV